MREMSKALPETAATAGGFRRFSRMNRRQVPALGAAKPGHCGLLKDPPPLWDWAVGQSAVNCNPEFAELAARLTLMKRECDAHGGPWEHGSQGAYFTV